MSKSLFYLDIPTVECFLNDDGPWQSIGKFLTKKEAVDFIREHVGPCDDEGRIELVTEGEMCESEEEMFKEENPILNDDLKQAMEYRT